MGNRAVITNDMNGIGIYLHWNGGRDSVEAFLEYCKLRGFRSVDSDPSYAWARLTQVIANFFGGGLSVGINQVKNLDCNNGDNGVYIIKGWEIVGRKFFKGAEQSGYNRAEMLQAIDEAQPKEDRIGEYLRAIPVDESELKVGDKVVILDWTGKQEICTVIGFGDCVVNGEDRTGKPYIDLYSTDNPKMNPNNYGHEYRLLADDPKEATTSEAPKAVEMFINEELKGIELKFNEKPDETIRETLKTAGFRWHRKKAIWYAKNTEERQKIATAIINALK